MNRLDEADIVKVRSKFSALQVVQAIIWDVIRAGGEIPPHYDQSVSLADLAMENSKYTLTQDSILSAIDILATYFPEMEHIFTRKNDGQTVCS